MKLVITDWYDPQALREVEDKEATLYDPAFVFPLSAKTEILEVCTELARLKRISDDAFRLLIQLCNKQASEGRRR